MKKLLFLSLAFALCTAQASILSYSAVLSGPAESPPNGSPGTGSASVFYDNVAHTLDVEVVFSGLVAPTTASHIHCCTTIPGVGTAGVATVTPSFTGFPLGVTAGTCPRTDAEMEVPQMH